MAEHTPDSIITTQRNGQLDRDRLDELVELMVDTVCSNREMIRIAGDDYPAEVVKSRFLKDILKLVNALILNTKGEGEKSSEDFWVKAERLYYSALIGYIWYEAEPEERNFITLLDLINASEAREDDEEFQSPVDLLFAKLEKEHPDHFAVKQYRKFKMAAGDVCSK